MHHLQQELTALKRRVSEMGALATAMVAGALEALVSPDPQHIAAVIGSEPALDRRQIEIDAEAIRLLTIYSPAARDLRFLLMIARVTSELERIGDEAVDNCEYLRLLTTPQPLHELDQMSTIVLGMVRNSLAAFDREDTRGAQAVMALDDRVDALNADIVRRLLEQPAVGAEPRARSLSLVLLARSLERMADHATNICEEVFYMVVGADIRHQSEVTGTP